MPRTLVAHAEARHRHTGLPETDAGWRGFTHRTVGDVLLLHDTDHRHISGWFHWFLGRYPEVTDAWHGLFFWNLQDAGTAAMSAEWFYDGQERSEAEVRRMRVAIYGMAFVCGIVPNFSEPQRYRLTEGKRQRL